MSTILASHTLTPPFRYHCKEVVEKIKTWLAPQPEDFRRKAVKIFEGAQIEYRHSFLDIETVFSNLSFKEKNDLYMKAAIEAGTRVLDEALKKANIRPDAVDYIITTSCTGFMIPSVDAYMVNSLGLKQDIVRLPVTEMGCAGGTMGMIYANEILKGSPDKIVALVSVEIPSITFLKNDLSMENLVSTAIFADGASCLILAGEQVRYEGVKPKIIATETYHFPKAEYFMGYNLTNEGLKIVLDKDVPAGIEEHFPNIINPFLKKNNLDVAQVENYMFHPGGKKIIHMVDKYISQFGKDISDSKDVLKYHGNMSSSTILYILDRFMKKEIKKGEKGYLLAFGPGFTASQILVQWS